jgi:hypothetical protein
MTIIWERQDDGSYTDLHGSHVIVPTYSSVPFGGQSTPSGFLADDLIGQKTRWFPTLREAKVACQRSSRESWREMF